MRIIAKNTSKDGMTTLYTQETEDGRARILTTYVNRPEKHIICFTTTVGCPIECRFCYAPQFAMPISSGELFRQVQNVHNDQDLRKKTLDPEYDHKPVLFSAMGEGEPLASRAGMDVVVTAMQAMSAGFPRARLAISTMAINPGLLRELALLRMTTVLKVQVSLISGFDNVRASLMKTAAPLSEVRGAVDYYEQVSRTQVEWNLVLLEDVNDSDVEAIAVARLLGPGSKVKLNRYNEVAGREFVASTRRDRYGDILRKMGLAVEQYQTDGWDVGAACGQFRSTVVSIGEMGRR